MDTWNKTTWIWHQTTKKAMHCISMAIGFQMSDVISSDI